MRTTANTPRTSPWKALLWFDARWRAPGTWAFALNRITALGLALYLFIHLIVLSSLARGEEAYEAFLASVEIPVIHFGSFLVVVAGIYHGLNGLRIALTSFGIAVRYQKAMFLGILVFTIITSTYIFLRMFHLI
jgi:succinate dehydrogenase / fumarate reductase, cytochrome b subunit